MAESFEYACGKCPKVFKTAVGLGSHQKSHNPLVRCDMCGLDVKNIDAHKRKEHPETQSNSDVESLLRVDNQRLRDLIVRKDREISRLKGKLGQVIREGRVRV